MDPGALAVGGIPTWLFLSFAGLVGLATLLVWFAFAPDWRRRAAGRLEGYVEREELPADAELSRPFVSRAVAPLLHGLLRTLGRLSGTRGADQVQQLLVQAGQPGGLAALDVYGLRLLSGLLLAAAYALLLGGDFSLNTIVRSLVAFMVGYLLPMYWLRARVRRRKHKILCALPDALDMLTVGVEAGLAFESALLKVGEQWDNPLTQEFRRAVAEMRVGTPRDEALARMVERTGVQELRTFVAVLVQSTQLGVSLAQVLHSQADRMRIRRRQRAEELARQAGVKMIFPLALLIFPALIVVILGPSIPGIGELLRTLTGVGGPP